MSSPTTHVLFVCTGNTCRSPMAEALFRAVVGDREGMEVSSAGVAAADGAPASRETVEILTKRGLSLEGFRSRQITMSIAADATHIFCLTQRHADVILRAFPEAASKISLVCDFLDYGGDSGFDVPDPFGMGPEAYVEVAEVLDDAIPTLVSYIDQTSN